jgi:hypothetical protein
MSARTSSASQSAGSKLARASWESLGGISGAFAGKVTQAVLATGRVDAPVKVGRQLALV